MEVNSTSQTMLDNIPFEFRKFEKNCAVLKKSLKDTLKSLDEIKQNNVLGQDIKDQLLNPRLIDPLRNNLNRTSTLVVLGQNNQSKACFVNYLFDEELLPMYGSNWRWIKLSYGFTKKIVLMLGEEFEIVQTLKANEENWSTIPDDDLVRDPSESPRDHCSTLEVELNHKLLSEKMTILIPPDCSVDDLNDVLSKNMDNVLPVLVYCITGNRLTDTNYQELRIIKEKFSDYPILFISLINRVIKSTESLTESEQHRLENGEDSSQKTAFYDIQSQLTKLGYLSDLENPSNEDVKKNFCTEFTLDNKLITDEDIEKELVKFSRDFFRMNLLKMSSLLSEIHTSCLRIFILTAFDMAREIQITPRRIMYVQNVEMKLYKALMEIASEKQEEIAKIINVTLQNMKSNVGHVLEDYIYRDEESGVRPQSAKMATMELHQLVLRKLSNSVGTQLVESVGCLRESYTGTLQRCLESLEKNCHDFEGMASNAVKQILAAAYTIDLKSSSSFSLVHNFIDRLRKLVNNFQLPWSTCIQPYFNTQWQEQVIINMIDSLSASKLAKTISTQFQEHVKSSHEAFQSAMKSLENQLSGQLEQTEEQRIAIRKKHAPRFARLTLDSTSMCDLIRYGMPKQLREIGRGQYGVVFACESWGNVNPCAVKSVVPPDDRHWRDLSMEFYYTRTIPEHPRIVKLRGSVIDHTYGGGNSLAVLLIMERMTRDLYCGLRDGLSWLTRLQIAIDVVEGIRYLHSQGLVHRDIKLKNVLLDKENRAKLTDFGFCIPEAMMSGSIVGTPIHMAPELLSGRYDSSVDVYAFGILFWYICAGQTRLPNHFEGFHNKEQLWSNVRKGIRPECLSQFNEACWNLMEQCWAAEPCERPLLGYVQPQLEAIKRNAESDISEDA